MLGDLNELNLLRYINRNVEVRIRKFQDGELRLNPPAQTGDLVHKCSNIYALILPRQDRLILWHLKDNWFRAKRSPSLTIIKPM